MGLLAPRQKPKPNLKISRANLRDNSQIQSQTWSHLNTENSQKKPKKWDLAHGLQNSHSQIKEQEDPELVSQPNPQTNMKKEYK